MSVSSNAPFVSRGGLKLQAAIERFELASIVAGATALDVGASHGGFTDCLLRYGAAHVTGVDVGHGQMREPLRSDPRVTLYERTHFKHAPLSLAPGPFGLFVVDVSFASARSMLRGISQRIAPGVVGVVLVKPQFELPASLVPRGGVVASRGLRKLAFNRFRKKAWLLGFTVLGRLDSPVPGGDGNVEILTLVRWDGRPDPEVDRGPHPPIPNLTPAPVAEAPPVAPKPARPRT